MKNNILSHCALVLATITTLGVVSPVVSADTTSELNQVTTEISTTKQKISDTQKEIDKATELQIQKSQKIADDKASIAQHRVQLQKQVRSAQLNSPSSLVEFVVNSKNITDGFSRIITAGRVFSANNASFREQQSELKQVEAEQDALTKSVNSQKQDKLSLLRMEAKLQSEQADLNAKKNKEDQAAQEQAKAAKKAAAAAKKAKDLASAAIATDKAYSAANVNKTKVNHENQQKAVKTTAPTPVKTSFHGVGGGANGYPAGQCTYYVKMMAPWVGGHWGNGGEWAASAASAGFRVDHTPEAGAVAVYAGGADVGGWTAAPGYGHVALVQSVSGSSITITQGGTGFDNPMGPNTQTVPAGNATYIHKN